MKEKIHFYEEILRLEPESRLFYSLAKLYVSEQRYTEAIHLLRRGIEAHPSHFEAKLLLISTLASCGDRQGELAAEVQSVFQIIQKNISLWIIFSDVISEHDPKLSLALRLLTLALQERSVDWNQVLETGLKMTLATSNMPQHDSKPFLPPEPQPIKTNVRTRTMADLLLQQNDPYQARKIYQELLQTTDNELEKSELNFMLNKTITPEEKQKNETKNKEKDELSLINTLSALADRFESKAQTNEAE